MKLKLSHNEFIAMLKIFVAIVLVYQVNNLTEKMHKALMMQIYEKLYKQAISSKKHYCIKLTTPEAIAFYFFWHTHIFSNPSSYEANIIRTTNNLIHQKIIV